MSVNDRQTTSTYYGNHEPYITPEPRKPWAKLLLGAPLLGLALISTVPTDGFDAAKDGTAEFIGESLGGARTFLVGAEPGQPEPPELSTPHSPVSLQAGDSIRIPCASVPPYEDACMTITLTDAQPFTVCEGSWGESSSYAVLSLTASLSPDAGVQFRTPFAPERWSVTAASDFLGSAGRAVEPELGCGDDSYLDLMALTPGASASGNVWLPVPEGAAVVGNGEAARRLFSVLVHTPSGT